MDINKRLNKNRRRKKWTKKRIRRYAKAWAFRILAAAIAVAIVLFAFFILRAVVRGIAGRTTEDASRVSSGETETMDVTSETEARTEPVIKTLKLTATGDCALAKELNQKDSGSFEEAYRNNGETYFFENVRSVFEADDLTLINLECVLSATATEMMKKPYHLKGDPSYTGIMTCSSVEAASLGNNHTEDYLEQGFQDTKDALTAAGITWALDSEVGYYTTEDGIRVAILSREAISITESFRKTMCEEVAAVKASGKADLIIACCHWGSEKKYTPSGKMITLAHELIDAGADVIIGNHPHVLQGMEVYNGKMICYSLGNCCFGGNFDPYDYRTMLYQQTFTFKDGVLQPDLDVNVLPARVSSVEKPNNFQPTLVEGEQKQDIINLINKYSAKLGGVTVLEDGRVTVSEIVNTTAAVQ